MAGVPYHRRLGDSLGGGLLLAAAMAGCGDGLPATLPDAQPFVAAPAGRALLLDTEVGAQAVPDVSWADAPPAATYHVATTGDDAAPGTAAQPWRTVGKAARTLGPGEAAVVHGGVYVERVTLSSAGRAGAPLQLLAAAGETPVLRGGGGLSGPILRVSGAYWVVDGFEIDGAASGVHGVRFDGADHGVVRRCEVHSVTGPASVAFNGGAHDVAMLGCRVHDSSWGSGQDSHGFVITPDAARVLVRGNESWGNAGDSLQCVGPDVTSGTAVPVDVTIEGNHFHADGENAVDIKSCDRVTIRGNEFNGYRPASTAPQGAAMVVHMSASRVLIEANRIWDNGRALSLGGVQVWDIPVTDVAIRRNVIFDHTTDQLGSGDGLRVGTSRRVELTNNTIVGMPNAGIRIGDGSHGATEDPRVLNNVLVDTGRALDMVLDGITGLTSDRNLAFQTSGTPQFRASGTYTDLAGWQARTGQDPGSIIGDPRFVADARANGFRTRCGSAARDVGLLVGAPFCGPGPDVGAPESCR